MSELSEFALPTNPLEIERIKNSIIEISAQLQMIKDRQDGMKTIKTILKEEYKMPTSLVNKLVKALDDAAYVEMTTEHSTFELVRETIMGDGGLPDDSEVD
jgi:hypothetical protein